MVPKVTVIIPNYNHANYLVRRIESVLNQTYGNFEVIILDDCSTDDSREVILRFRENPLIKTIIFNDKNSGSPFQQWKLGISQSTGEWIWIAESDDYADERFLEIMIAACSDHKNVGLVYCDSNIVLDNRVSQETFAALKNKKFNTNRWNENHINNGLNEIENYLLLESTINNTSAVLFKRKILLDANPFDLDLTYIGDKYAFIKVLANTNIVYIQNVLNYYRDPFNNKHKDKYLLYTYEQFLVYNWVYKNLKALDCKKFFLGFYSNTRNSIFRNWTVEKILVYKKLLFANPILFSRFLINNVIAPFRK